MESFNSDNMMITAVIGTSINPHVCYPLDTVTRPSPKTFSTNVYSLSWSTQLQGTHVSRRQRWGVLRELQEQRGEHSTDISNLFQDQNQGVRILWLWKNTLCAHTIRHTHDHTLAAASGRSVCIVTLRPLTGPLPNSLLHQRQEIWAQMEVFCKWGEVQNTASKSRIVLMC